MLRRVCELHIMNGPLFLSFISCFGLIFKTSLGLKLIIVSILSFSVLMTILNMFIWGLRNHGCLSVSKASKAENCLSFAEEDTLAAVHATIEFLGFESRAHYDHSTYNY